MCIYIYSEYIYIFWGFATKKDIAIQLRIFARDFRYNYRKDYYNYYNYYNYYYHYYEEYSVFS